MSRRDDVQGRPAVDTRIPESMAARLQRAQSWAIGSGPGLLRLRMATRTTAALGCSLLVLYLLTMATGQPLTVALIGVVITMIAARSVDDPDSRQQQITMALLPVPAALSISVAALLAPHLIAAEVAFVVIVFAAVYVRRFGPRGRALGMVAFMAYFFSLYLRAGVAQLPWMIGAVLVGTLCTFVMSTYVLPDRPESVLRATIRSLRARMAIVVDTAADTVRAGRLDERRRRRMRARIARLNETALLVQSQIEDKTHPATLWPGISAEQLAPWLFDAELSVEWVAIAGHRAMAIAEEIPAATRIELADTLTQLAWAIRGPRTEGLHQAASRAQRLLDGQPAPAPTDGPEPGRRAPRPIRTTTTWCSRYPRTLRQMVGPAKPGWRPPHDKPSRSASRRHWPSSPVSWFRRCTGIGR